MRWLALLTIMVTSGALAAPESSYRDWWCEKHQGTAEVRLADGTRADCITATHAIEFEFAEKWAQGPGQARHYACMTGRLPGLVIIVEDTQGSWRYVPRLIHALGDSMRVWVVTEEDLP